MNERPMPAEHYVEINTAESGLRRTVHIYMVGTSLDQSDQSFSMATYNNTASFIGCSLVDVIVALCQSKAV